MTDSTKKTLKNSQEIASWEALNRDLDALSPAQDAAIADMSDDMWSSTKDFHHATLRVLERDGLVEVQRGECRLTSDGARLNHHQSDRAVRPKGPAPVEIDEVEELTMRTPPGDWGVNAERVLASMTIEGGTFDAILEGVLRCGESINYSVDVHEFRQANNRKNAHMRSFQAVLKSLVESGKVIATRRVYPGRVMPAIFALATPNETPAPVETTPVETVETTPLSATMTAVETTPVNFHLRRLADWDFTKRAPKLKPATTPATLPLSADTVRLKTPAKWTAPWRAAYSLAWVAGENSIKIDSLTGVIGSGFIVLIAPPVVIIDGLIADGWTVETTPVESGDSRRRADLDAKLETLKAIVEGLAWTAGGGVAAFLLRSGYVTKGTHGTLNPTRRGRRVVERQWPKLEARRASEPPAPLKLKLSKPKSKARHAAEAINKAARDVGVDLDGREIAASFAELDGSIILIKPPRRLVDALVADGWTKQGLS